MPLSFRESSPAQKPFGFGVRHAVAASAIALSGLSLTACTSDSAGGVIVGFYPLEYLATTIMGDKQTVENLAQPGAEPHDMELTAQQVGSLSTASLVIYEKGLQPALDDAIANESPANTLDVSTVTTLMEGYEDLGHDHAGDDHATDESAEDDHSEEDHADEEHTESTLDPHIWLDPKLMLDMATAVHDTIVEIDPDNTQTYDANYADVKANLEKLDADFTAGLAQCERTSIVTTHNAFGYLAKAYGLEQVGISGLTDQEPSPQKLAEVKAYVETNGVTTIFYESNVSDDYAQTIANETGATTAVLNPLEVASDSGDYIAVMEENLQALRTALSCA